MLSFAALELRGDSDPRTMSREEMIKIAESLHFTSYYVHRWLRAPDLETKTLEGADAHVASTPGFVDVTFFIASWCIPCQQLTKKVKSLTEHFQPYNVRFHYVFAHDRAEDARVFARAYAIKDGLIANNTILKDFHNPPLPAIYLTDKNGWFFARYISPSDADIKDLENLLDKLATF